jgi:hypothetical protein
LRINEASGAVITHQCSLAPRTDYTPGDPPHEGYHLLALAAH